MYKCQNCGQEYNESVKFCGSCGSSNILYTGGMTPAGTFYGEPAAPAYYEAPKAEESLATSIMGMAFGGVAFFLAFYMFFYTIGYSVVLAWSFSAKFTYITVYSMFQLPLSILGMIFSKKATRIKGLCIAGKITSIVSFVFYGLACIVALFA